jgi:tetratricopeptide (TPR) repeat protein
MLRMPRQKQPDRAHAYFKQALERAQLGLSKEDPANRALAVAGNNLACALEEKTDRSEKEKLLMILAAETGRKFWEIAGGWKEILWAEYRLAMTYRKAGDSQKAMDHAQTCIEVAQENKASALELFYGYEALALVERDRGNKIGFEKALGHAKDYFSKLEGDDKSWCKGSMEKLAANTPK